MQRACGTRPTRVYEVHSLNISDSLHSVQKVTRSTVATCKQKKKKKKKKKNHYLQMKSAIANSLE